MLKIGDKAPAFYGEDQEGNEVSLDKYHGKKIILYFYPKDSTPGCTAEACNFRDNYLKLSEKGFDVVGVSADNALSHKKFSQKNVLPFALIPDKARKIIRDYSVWGLKKLYGKEYEGILRTTFVISENGIIEQIFTKVDTKNPTRQILDAMGIQ